MSKQEITYDFDVNKFEKNREGNEWEFTQTDGTKVRQIKESDGYTVEITPLNSAYTYINIYNIQGIIQVKALEFYGIEVGQWLYFNDRQQIVKELNNEKSYPFSIEALAKLLKEDYSFDLFDPNQILTMQRYIDNKNTHKPFYEVYAYQQNGLNKSNIDCYLIDGEIGKVLFVTKRSLRSDKNLYNEYIKTTEEYKQGIYKIGEE